MQPIALDDRGVARFQRNKVVCTLVEEARKRGFDLNDLLVKAYGEPKGDWEQFNQMLGLSVCGFGDCNKTRRRTFERAQAKVDKLLKNAP